MTIVEWKKEFTLGIPSVDYEHEELVGLLNELHDGLSRDSDGAAIGGFLGEVFTRISAHFALEEQIMRQRKYVAFDDHKADHEALLDEIREIMDAQETGAYEELEERLASALQVWFTGHFKTHDAQLHKMLGDSFPGVEEI